MGLKYEKNKYNFFKKVVQDYQQELLNNRKSALDMPVETENGFNVEREMMLFDIDEKLDILKRHANNPYFAKLIFTDIYDSTHFQGYIGRISIGDIHDKSDNKIVDWRAPIANLYYNGKIGRSTYTALEKQYNVDLQLKRQINIENDEVTSIYDFEDTISNDEFLKPYLSKSVDARLKSIVATIQKEQDNIIRLPFYKNFVCQGVAGSGKTTVALHRLSYLMYNYKNKVKANEYLVISPNEVFSSYISGVLSDLDANQALVLTINKLIKNIINTQYTLLNKHDQYTYLTQQNHAHDYLNYKGQSNLAVVLEDFLKDYHNQNCNKPLTLNGVEFLSAKEVKAFFPFNATKTLDMQIVHGCKKLALSLAYDNNLKEKVNKILNNSNLDINKVFDIRKKFQSANAGYLTKIFKNKFNILTVYRNFITNIEKYSDYKHIKILKQSTLKNIRSKKLSHDDFACILYIACRLGEYPFYNNIKYIILDEAQDLSQLMFKALKMLFKNATFAVFGDIAQGIYSYQSISNWQQVTSEFELCDLIYLTKSYRTSVEIMQDANITLQKIGLPKAENVIRHGEPVEYIGTNDVHTIKSILENSNKQFKHTAIICKDDNQLNQAIHALSDLHLTVVDESNYNLNGTNYILTVQMSKGLEFDCVIVYDNSAYTSSELDLKLLYVAKTRALHKLYVLQK